MIFNHEYMNEEYPERIVSINNAPVESNTIFKYLGCNIKYANHLPEIQNWRCASIQRNTGFMSLRKKNNELQNHALYSRKNHGRPRA